MATCQCTTVWQPVNVQQHGNLSMFNSMATCQCTTVWQPVHNRFKCTIQLAMYNSMATCQQQMKVHHPVGNVQQYGNMSTTDESAPSSWQCTTVWQTVDN
ncbi:hypothetical protein DPMN_121691 [Dreissena polymorpha]|uniref:Uncharacterized protein n=1 Tax=Dreissena polymorpha TaxID=45954 RepID=A0A9D4GU18_DREPO|nr:hypothetical protein DPMN_121691 [Dreissena polymorpha]